MKFVLLLSALLGIVVPAVHAASAADMAQIVSAMPECGVRFSVPLLLRPYSRLTVTVVVPREEHRRIALRADRHRLQLLKLNVECSSRAVRAGELQGQGAIVYVRP